ncbi:ankyrin repeat-containing domain protein [Xylariomycetidae sp. FL2044]|nr:ankyrin repeat-containing domain protein [Xylariomycetidae sp. FL2044]
MDGISAAASIIAILELTGKVYSLCQQYVLAARNARRDIEVLCAEVAALHDVLLAFDDWLQDVTDTTSFSILIKVQASGTFDICKRELESIKDVLQSFIPLTADGSRSRGISLRLKWPLSSKDVQDRIIVLATQKQTLILALAAESTKATANLSEDISNLTITVERAFKEASEEKVLRWLETASPTTNHLAAVSKHKTSTGDWLLEHESYKKWLSGSAKTLWLRGIPGSGKTILTSTVIESLKGGTSAQSALVYYYFDFTEPSKQNATNFIHSLLAQACVLEPRDSTAALRLYTRCRNGQDQPAEHHVQEAFVECTERFKGVYIVVDALDESPRGEERENVLAILRALARRDNVHLLVASRIEADIVESLQNLRALNIEVAGVGVDGDIKNYISSQFLQDSKLRRFSKDLKESVETELTNKAHGMFRWVFCQIEELKKCRTKAKFLQAIHTLPETLSETYTRIIDSIDPDFQDHVLRSLAWIAFAKRPLKLSQVAEAAVIDPDATVPFDPDNRFFDPENDILDLLGSLVVLDNHVEDLKIFDDSEHSDTLSESTDICRSLSDPVVKLAHFTVKEYLITHWQRISINSTTVEDSVTAGNPTGADLFLCKSSLHYTLYILERLSPRQYYPDGAFPLLSYAAEIWPTHAHAVPSRMKDEIDPLIMRLLESPGPLDKWRELYASKVASIHSTQLHYAAAVGCTKLVLKIIDSKNSRVAKNTEGATALDLATRENQTLTTETSMAKLGCEWESPSLFPSPLYYASQGGHIDVLEAMLKHIPLNHSWSRWQNNPMHVAAQEAHHAIVKKLLAFGVSPSDRNIYGQTPLHAVIGGLRCASEEGRVSMLNMLLDAGADINAQDDRGRTPLYAAMYKATTNLGIPLSLLESLLSRGPSLNLASGLLDKCDTPLLRIVSSRYHAPVPDVVELLLHYGADPTAVNLNGDTAIILACKSGVNVKLIERLAQAGASVTAAAHDGMTPLHAACSRMQVTTIKKLLEMGASESIGARIKTSRDTPLLMACKSSRFGSTTEHVDQPDIVDSLHDAGADIEAPDDEGMSPLMWCAFKGRCKMCERLVELGADVNAKRPNGATALHYVIIRYYRVHRSWSRHEDSAKAINLVRLLLKNGASLDAALNSVLLGKERHPLRFSGGQTPLAMAREMSDVETREAIVELLLSYGAQDVDITPCHSET